ncbi:Ldh family oxidoreductase [Deinococcus sp. UYEF24]
MKMQIGEVQALVQCALEAAGYTAEEGKIITDHLIDCELRGLSFGGAARALSIIERFAQTAQERRPIGLVRETPVSATFDGGDQVGYLVADRVTNTALQKAQHSGIAIVGAYETWYTGMFSYYLERVTAAGFVGMVAGSGGPLVAPHGGTQGRFATNPIAFGFPTTGVPIIWDVGTSSIMLGEVLLNMRLGQPLPEGVAYDAEGQPTTDPASALGGALTVWGGHKGSGLALVVQLLGMLAGAAAAPQGLRDCGFLMLVVNPDILTPADDFKRRASEYAQSLRGTRPVDPAKPVRVPFERSAAERERRLGEGTLELPEPLFTALQQIAARR